MIAEPLTSTDDEDRAAAFDDAVLESLGLSEPTDAQIERWARVYVHVHTALVTADSDISPRGPSALISAPERSGWDQADLDALWGFIFAARTFHVAHRLLRAYPPGSGDFVELGAGWAPFAFAASLRDRSPRAHLLDVSAERLDCARRLFAAAELPQPDIEVTDVRSRRWSAPSLTVRRSGVSPDVGTDVGFASEQEPSLRDATTNARPSDVSCDRTAPLQKPHGLGGVAVPHSLGEMLGGEGPESAAQLLERWTAALSPGGRLYVLAPGTRSSARALQAARDLIASRDKAAIIAPCAGPPRCPLLVADRDWCHFKWRLPLGPIGRRIADRASFRWQELTISWLVLARPEEAPRFDPDDGRLLELRRLGAGKRGARFCTPEGALLLTVLDRNHEATEKVDALEPGARVHLNREGISRRGDGYRLDDATALELEVPL